MNRLRFTAVLLVLAVLAAITWLRLPSSTGPVWGYALVDAYYLVSGTPSTIMGIDGATLAAVILSRPLMWLFFGYAVAVAVVPCSSRFSSWLAYPSSVSPRDRPPAFSSWGSLTSPCRADPSSPCWEESPSSFPGRSAPRLTSSLGGDSLTPSPTVTVTVGDGVKLSPRPFAGRDRLPLAANGWFAAASGSHRA